MLKMQEPRWAWNVGGAMGVVVWRALLLASAIGWLILAFAVFNGWNARSEFIVVSFTLTALACFLGSVKERKGV